MDGKYSCVARLQDSPSGLGLGPWAFGDLRDLGVQGFGYMV